MTEYIDKPLLTINEQIEKMVSKGITFNYCTHDEAKRFLQEHNNYFRLTSYRKLYDKYPVGENAGKYRDLDFQYLRELSTIDMHLRFLVIKMCLDIEHYLKIDLLRKAEVRNDDGFESIDKFFSDEQNDYIKNNIYRKKQSIYCKDLVDYCFKFDDDNKTVVEYSKCRIWDLLECLTFGEFLRFYDFYHKEYKIKNSYKHILISIKNLRNACAHNNCIISQLYQKGALPDRRIVDFIDDNIDSIGATTRKKHLKKYAEYEIICLLYMYQQIVPDTIKSHRFKELDYLVNERMIKNADYFKTQQVIVSSYKFLKKIVDFLLKK